MHSIKSTDSSELRKFGLILSMSIMIFSSLIFILFDKPWKPWPYALGLCILALSIIYPKANILIYRPWMLLANILHKINSTLILSFSFLFIILPIALLKSVFGKKVIEKNFDTQLETYKKPSPQLKKSDMEKPY